MLHTYLDLSTSHVTERTEQQLPQAAAGFRIGWPALTIAPYAHGYFITVPDPLPGTDLSALPEDLAQVLAYARGLGAAVVRLDADGETTDQLPTYDW